MKSIEKSVYWIELFPELGAQIKSMVLLFSGPEEPPSDLRFGVPEGSRGFLVLIPKIKPLKFRVIGPGVIQNPRPRDGQYAGAKTDPG